MIAQPALAALPALMLALPVLGKPPQVGDTAPPFQVHSLAGKSLALSDLAGQVVVLNFWATWCGPCREELPLLEAFQRMRGHFGLTVVAVTQESAPHMARLRKLDKKMAMTLYKSFRGDYGPIAAVPTNFVIDRTGHIRYAQSGAFSLDELNKLLIPLLNEPGQPAPATPAATTAAAP